LPNSRPIRIVFFGTPGYAVPALRGLAESSQFEIALVVTQPDRSGGRRGMIEPAVKAAARELGLPVIQPSTVRDESVREQLRGIESDLFVVAAYGLIFSQAVLDIPRSGCVNLHASILPAYRGAAPIPAAILNGDTETGVTLMMMERGLDTGPIIAIGRTPVEPTDTTETLTGRLARIGANLAVQLLPDLVDGEIVPTPQPEGATVVRQLTKADGQIDWTRPASEIERRVRAMWPWPRAWSSLDGRQLQVHSASVVESTVEGSAGAIVIDGGHPAVGCGVGALLIERGQIAGGKPVSGRELVSGRALKDGDRFAVDAEPHPAFIVPA
jgi:methionyl-tRNA formyltransferase